MNEDLNKFMGYKVEDDKLILTNEQVFTEVGATDKDIKKWYNEYKNCNRYIQAAKIFNNLYSSDLLKNSYQSILNDTVSYPFDINLVLIDTYLLYDILKDNTKLLAVKKHTSLLSEKVEPKTEYMEKVTLIELAMKNIDLLEYTTKLQVIALVIQTIKDSEVIENIKYL